MKVYLCGNSGCCPAIEVNDDKILIGEEGNLCALTKDQWNDLVGRIKLGELKAI